MDLCTKKNFYSRFRRSSKRIAMGISASNSTVCYPKKSKSWLLSIRSTSFMFLRLFGGQLFSMGLSCSRTNGMQNGQKEMET
jgi:hypothetical protein